MQQYPIKSCIISRCKDSKKKADPKDSDEYQAVKKFYEDEGCVIQSLEEAEELKNSIEEKAGLTADMIKFN